MLNSRFDTWLRCHVGHRGSFLIFLGIFDVIYGWSMFAVGGATGRAAEITLWLPWQAWGTIWIAVGVFLIIGAFFHHDRAHYAVATAAKFIWAAFWFTAWNYDHIPRGWVSAVVWLTFAALVFVVSYWPEPRPVVHPSEELKRIIEDHTPPEGYPAIEPEDKE